MLFVVLQTIFCEMQYSLSHSISHLLNEVQEGILNDECYPLELAGGISLGIVNNLTATTGGGVVVLNSWEVSSKTKQSGKSRYENEI